MYLVYYETINKMKDYNLFENFKVEFLTFATITGADKFLAVKHTGLNIGVARKLEIPKDANVKLDDEITGKLISKVLNDLGYLIEYGKAEIPNDIDTLNIGQFDREKRLWFILDKDKKRVYEKINNED